MGVGCPKLRFVEMRGSSGSAVVVLEQPAAPLDLDLDLWPLQEDAEKRRCLGQEPGLEALIENFFVACGQGSRGEPIAAGRTRETGPSFWRAREVVGNASSRERPARQTYFSSRTQ